MLFEIFIITSHKFKDLKKETLDNKLNILKINSKILA